MLTLPVADALRETYPNAVIDMLVQSRVFELVNDYPALNKVISIDTVTSGKVKEICQSGRYDLAIAVYPSFELVLGLWRAGVKYRLGTGYRWYSFLLNLQHYQHRKEALKHESRYNLDLLKELNLFYEKQLEPVIQVTDEYLHTALSKINVSNSGSELNTNDEFIVIHVPSLGSAKVWSDQNFTKLLYLLLLNENPDYKLVFTGTESEKEQVLAVIGDKISNNRVLSVFNLNLKELAALLSKSKLFLGNSTGPIHIAAAVGTYVVGLYSPVKVESPVRWGPLTEKKKIFVPVKDSNDYDVMNDIKPEEVSGFIENYMKNLK